jgi:hypothetical protein
MALLSFVDSPPRAYGLKAGNADPPISTMGGTSPSGDILILKFANASSKPKIFWVAEGKD